MWRLRAYGADKPSAQGSGDTLPTQRTHSLRHACATHLLQEGLSLKEIGDLLGHRSAMSTGIYAKVDITMLRRVADFDLGGLL